MTHLQFRQYIHSTSTVTTHGNSTKRIELVASYRHSASEVAAILEWGSFQATIVADEIRDIGETQYLEGQLVLRSHLVRERNQALVTAAKSEFRSKYGRLYCEVCSFNFELQYGELGSGFIEAHHDIPLSQRDGSSETRIADLRMVCANCHRMLHRNFENNPVSIDLLKTIVTIDRSTG